MMLVKIQPCGCLDSLKHVKSAYMSGRNLLLLKFTAQDLTLIILAGCRVLLFVLDFHKLCMFNKKYYVTLKVVMQVGGDQHNTYMYFPYSVTVIIYVVLYDFLSYFRI